MLRSALMLVLLATISQSGWHPIFIYTSLNFADGLSATVLAQQELPKFDFFCSQTQPPAILTDAERRSQ